MRIPSWMGAVIVKRPVANWRIRYHRAVDGFRFDLRTNAAGLDRTAFRDTVGL